MKKRFSKNLFLLLLSLFAGHLFLSALFPVPTRAFLHSRDTLSLTWPSAPSDHEIIFQSVEGVPAGGRLSFVPEAPFNIPASFDFEDVDLAVADDASGPFTERPLAAVADVVNDGVVVTPGGVNARVDIEINPSTGIDAGQYIRIKLGRSASYGSNGLDQIFNPSATGAHIIRLEAYDAANVFIERSRPAVYILEPVRLGNNITKRRQMGAPDGWLANGTTQTILSLMTNFNAFCRWSLASGTPYDAMTGEFSYLDNTPSQYHTVIVGGLTSGQVYQYYVRCHDKDRDIKNDVTECHYTSTTTSSDLCLDYPIRFQVSSIAGADSGLSGTGSGGTGTGGGSGNNDPGRPGGGGSGGGSGGGLGNDRGRDRGTYLPYPPPPDKPGVVLQGWSFPDSDVQILKDGVLQGQALADPSSSRFGGFVASTTKGVYTFTLWANDSAGRKSNTYSTTFWVDDNTQTTLDNIIVPPTIALDRKQVAVGETVKASGYAPAKALIEVSVFSSTEAAPIWRKEMTASDKGFWELLLDPSVLPAGNYTVKAKAKMIKGESPYSVVENLAVGSAPVEEKPSEGTCPGADLNGDKKVNLFDFSILLYNWGTNNKCSDLNASGKVDLIDFSIMMYHWTG